MSEIKLEECPTDLLVPVYEMGVTVLAKVGETNSKKSSLFLNSNYSSNRSLVTNLLANYVESGMSVLKPVKCLDAMGSSGLVGLIWKKQLGDRVEIIINNPSLEACRVIEKNAQSNNLQVTVTKNDPCVLLHEMGFNFVFLDCNSDASSFLDAAFRNIARNSLLVLTTKDDPSLQASNPEVALRHYGGHIIRTCYSKELGIRLVLAAMARSAAKWNKAIIVVCCATFKSSFTIAVRVQKGPQHANSCLQNIRMLSHCLTCEERKFHPVDTGFPVDVTNILATECLHGKHVVKHLGPLWAGDIFDADFIENTIKNSITDDLTTESLLKSIFEEARCPSKVAGESHGKRKKMDINTPPFYFNLHKHHPKVPYQKNINKVIEELKKLGYRASRTHFDRLAVRTDAPLEKLYEVMNIERSGE